jgi:SSS family solute:Na+ symporter
MTLLDWCIIWAPLICAMGFALYTARFNKSVVDFIAAGRCAGRYLLATAGAEAGSSAIAAIGLFQMTTKTGFAFQFWGPLYTTVPILLALLGWVSYRARETRVLSPGQFFEVRYSRPLRLFVGSVSFLSTMVAAGVGPAVGARFFVYFLHLPEMTWAGSIGFPTWELIALAYMGASVFFVLTGGAISVLISNCLEGMVSLIGYVIIIVALLVIFGWHHMVETLTSQPPGKSMVDPFDMKGTQDFNVYFILISLFQAVWGAGATFNTSAAKSPHEQRMAGILGTWRGFGFGLMRTLIAICALVYLQNPHFAAQSTAAHADWNAITNPGVHDQMQVPIAATYYLPWVVKGIFCSIMLMGLMAGTASWLHSTGTGFIQDVALPICNYLKVHIPERWHILFLRLAVALVATISFCLSTVFRQTQYLQLFWQIAGAVYGSGAGAVVVFGLYWKRGTLPAAWTTMIVGASVALISIYLQQNGYTLMFHGQDLLHGQYAALFTTLVCIATYIAVSLLTCRKPFNMDKMLHRGEYAVKGEKKHVAPPLWKRFNPAKIIGIDEEYTFWDRVIAFSIFGWVWGLFGISMVCLVWNLITPWPTQGWVNYWFIFGLCLPLAITIVTSVWFTIGSVREIRLFIYSLRHEKRDSRDDGTVGPGHPV